MCVKAAAEEVWTVGEGGRDGGGEEGRETLEGGEKEWAGLEGV